MVTTRPFIVRGWPMDVSGPPQDERKVTLDEAIDAARKLATDDRRYRMTQVVDDFGMRWAEFGPVWQATMGE